MRRIKRVNGFRKLSWTLSWLCLFSCLGCQAARRSEPAASDVLGTTTLFRFLGRTRQIQLTPERQTLGTILTLSEENIAQRATRNLLVTTISQVTKENGRTVPPEDLAEDIYVVQRGNSWWYFSKTLLAMPQVASQKIRPGNSILAQPMGLLEVWQQANDGNSVRAGTPGNIVQISVDLNDRAPVLFDAFGPETFERFVEDFNDPNRVLGFSDLDTVVVVRQHNGQSHNLVVPSVALLKANGLSDSAMTNALNTARFSSLDVYLVTNLEALLNAF